MSNHKADIQIGQTMVEVKSDMRDQLVANLRRRTRQSATNRHQRVHQGNSGKHARAEISGHVIVRGTMAEGEPQAVLIKNRSAHLEQDINRLRSRYAKILSED